MSGLQVAVEDRKADAVAHLAVARTQNTGPAFWVTTKDKGGRLVRPLFPSGDTVHMLYQKGGAVRRRKRQRADRLI